MSKIPDLNLSALTSEQARKISGGNSMLFIWIIQYLDQSNSSGASAGEAGGGASDSAG